MRQWPELVDADELAATWAVTCERLGVDRDDARRAVGAWIEALDAAPPTPGYSSLPATFADGVSRAVAGMSSPDALRWLDLILIELMGRFDRAFERADLPAVLFAEFRENAARMLARARGPERWARGVGDDIFLKDLGILRAALVPCASHVVFRRSGVPRRLLLSQRPLAMIRALAYFGLRCGGVAPFLENHVHPAMLAHFNPEGRERCYHLVAELLRRWPDSRGLMGLSWYYDPAVSAISPHLAYLRDVPERGGALFLPAGEGEDVVRGAIATSATRRRLYESGGYRPTRYLMAWSRRGLLARCGA